MVKDRGKKRSQLNLHEDILKLEEKRRHFLLLLVVSSRELTVALEKYRTEKL